MKLPRLARRLIVACLIAACPATALARNAVIFVADGLRYGSVTAATAPTMYALKKRGVDFTNSHALYPTLTTANASAIATGHYLGDTGDYANVLYTGFPVAADNNASVVFLEDDAILKEMKSHFGDGYLGPQSLVAAARAAGMMTAVVGKTGPSAIQDIAALESKGAIRSTIPPANRIRRWRSIPNSRHRSRQRRDRIRRPQPPSPIPCSKPISSRQRRRCCCRT